jgi:hypothetical protein
MHQDPLDAEGRRLNANLAAVEASIEAACRSSGRPRDAVRLLPITKYMGTKTIRRLHGLGVAAVGESRVQDTQRKRAELADLGGLAWHLVGHLQTNKVARAIELHECIHSVDSLRLAKEIDGKLAARGGAAPRLFLQVNVAGEAAKSGVAPEAALRILEGVHSETNLGYALCGLMTLAPLGDTSEAARPVFRRLRELRDQAERAGLLPAGAELSMGMSQDFEVAIEEGATLVRVGSRLFEGLAPD